LWQFLRIQWWGDHVNSFFDFSHLSTMDIHLRVKIW
jgi:hypothetical protein